MSVVERILQMKAEIKRKEAERDAALAAQHKNIQQREPSPQEFRQCFIKSQVEKITKESEVVKMLQQIEKEFLNSSNLVHGIAQQNGEQDSVRFKLLWRDNSTYHVHYKTPDAIESGWGYSFVCAEINPDTESITIHGKDKKIFNKTEWQNNKALIEKSVAEAFLHPFYSGEPQSSGWLS